MKSRIEQATEDLFHIVFCVALIGCLTAIAVNLEKINETLKQHTQPKEK